MRRIIFIGIIFISVISCDKGGLFEQNTALKGETWKSDNTIHFDVNIPDTTKVYNVLINTRNAGTYPYSNIYLFVTTHAPNGNILTDTFEINLADKSGRWYGKGIGNLFYLQTYYRKNVKFPYRGIYMFDIRHAMWKEDLEGISDIGLRVEKVR